MQREATVLTTASYLHFLYKNLITRDIELNSISVELIDEMVDKYMKEALNEMGIPSYVLVERLKVDEKIRVVKYLQERGTFKVKGAIALVAEKLDVSEPTIYRYLKKS